MEETVQDVTKRFLSLDQVQVLIDSYEATQASQQKTQDRLLRWSSMVHRLYNKCYVSRVVFAMFIYLLRLQLLDLLLGC